MKKSKPWSPTATQPNTGATSNAPMLSASNWRRRASSWKTPRMACAGSGNNKIPAIQVQSAISKAPFLAFANLPAVAPSDCRSAKTEALMAENRNTYDVIQDLIETCRDGQQGYL